MSGQAILWRSEDVILREISAEDAERIVQWRADPEVYRYFKNPRQITVEEHLAWFENVYAADANRLDFIVWTPEGLPVGTASVNWEPETGDAEVSYLISSAYRRQGWAKKAVKALCMLASERWPVRGFTAVINKENKASLEFIRALGFAPDKDEGQFQVFRKVDER